jgi:hypothetical protein
MMARTVSAHNVDTDVSSALDEMVECGEAASVSDAVEQTVRDGLEQRGYIGGVRDTPLRRLFRRFSDALALVGMVWLGLTFLMPVGFRALAIPFFASAIALHAGHKLLGAKEPAVSKRLAAVLGVEA